MLKFWQWKNFCKYIKNFVNFLSWSTKIPQILIIDNLSKNSSNDYNFALYCKSSANTTMNGGNFMIKAHHEAHYIYEYICIIYNGNVDVNGKDGKIVSQDWPEVLF